MIGVYALVGSPCLAEGHPSSCTEPAPGTIENTDNNSPLTVDGSVIADHGDKMFFPSHAHKYSDIDGDGSKECHDMQSHELVPDQNPPWTVNGRPLMQVGNDTTDPGSGGRAYIESTNQSSFELVD
jgi:uncharacterized Zn-binding protein involved in type VI secretion